MPFTGRSHQTHMTTLLKLPAKQYIFKYASDTLLYTFNTLMFEMYNICTLFWLLNGVKPFCRWYNRHNSSLAFWYSNCTTKGGFHSTLARLHQSGDHSVPSWEDDAAVRSYNSATTLPTRSGVWSWQHSWHWSLPWSSRG